MDPAKAHDGHVTMGAQTQPTNTTSSSSSTTTTPTPSQIHRQNSTRSTSSKSKARPRNVRGLSIAPATPISHTASSSSYASLGESASVIAAQRGGLSATPGTPRLNAGAISRPGTPSFGRAPTPLLGPPRTPGVGYVPLTPITPSGVVFSPNTPLYSPNALPPSKTAKLKSQLTSFLPAKHTYFHAKIAVEQLSSVPFVGGEFGVRWKFKNVHRHAATVQQEEAAGEEGQGQGIFGRMTSKSKSGSAKDKGKAREHPEPNEFGGYLPQHQDSVASTTTNSSTDTATTSESSSSATWSSASMSSMGSSSSAATKTGTSPSNSTPSTNLSRNFYSPYASASTTTMSPNSREAQYGPSQYLFNVTPAVADGPSPSSTASSTSSDPTSSLLFSPNAQSSFSSNAAHGALSPMSPGFSVVSPTGTVRVPQGKAANGAPVVSGVPQPAQVGHLSTARGMTRYLPLKDHSIAFNFPLEAIVKMDVNRSAAPVHASDTGVEGSEGSLGLGSELNPYDPHSQSSTSISSMMSPGAASTQQQQQSATKPNLQPSPLKLVVMQRVVPDDPSTVPQNPRLGAVFVNLAEYVGRGRVERRYLLKESRVNATLKLTIEVNYMSGYQGYVAPPLPKAEIQGGIEGFLKQHDTLLTKKKVKTMGASAVSRDAVSTDRGALGAEDQADGAGAAVQTEFEVDLLRRGFLEEEKDRIGEVLVAHMRVVEPGLGVAGQNGGGGGGTGANSDLNPRADLNPYELPSESESESEYGNRLEGVESDAEKLTTEALGRKLWMQELRKKKKDERAKRLMLDLSESEEESVFESADEGVQEDDESEVVQVKGVPAPKPMAHIRVAAFDVQRLPLAYGPKTTESLIDALFNPGITTDRTDDDPFVMYISPTELKRQEDWRREEEVRMRQIQEQLSMVQNQRQPSRDHHDHHWYRPRPSRSATVEEGGGGGAGLMTKLKRGVGVRRAGTIDSTTSASTTSGSGSGDSPDGLTRLKSPGEDTVVGVRMGEDADVMSPATITAWSPGRDGQHFAPLGIAVDREATIGKGAGGGATAGFAGIFSSYQRTKTKVKDRIGGKSRTKVVEEASVLGGAFYDQEPGEMYGSLGHGRGQGRAHQRSATGGTVSSTASSSSLSSLGLSSHGHNTAAQVPNSSAPQTSGTTAKVRRSTSTRSSTSTGDGHLMMAPSARPDFSAPPGRMDKTGVVKGAGPSPSLGDQGLEEGTGAGGGLKGWWKGLQR